MYAELAQLVQHRSRKPTFRKGARLRWNLSGTDRNGVENSGFGLRSTSVGAGLRSLGPHALLALRSGISQEKIRNRKRGKIMEYKEHKSTSVRKQNEF